MPSKAVGELVSRIEEHGSPADLANFLEVSQPPERLYVPRIAVVYMLHEAGRFYIGRSVDVVQRFLHHRDSDARAGMEDPDVLILVRFKPRTPQRLQCVAEGRFIAAAREMGLNLANRYVGYKADAAGVQWEMDRIKAACELVSVIP